MLQQYRRTAFVVKSKAQVGKEVNSVTGYQYAFLDENRGKTVEPIFPHKRFVYAAQGSPNRGQLGHDVYPFVVANTGNVDMPFLSEKIDLHSIKSVSLSKPVTTSKNTVGYLGYDGVSACDSLHLECGKTYFIEVWLRGAGIQSVFGQFEITEIIEITTPKCPPCTNDCDTSVDCSTIIDQAIRNIRMSKVISRFVQASKVMKCCPAPSPFTTVSCYEFNLTFCGEENLAAVQAQYPNDKVYVKNVSRGFVTYGLIKTTNTLPTAYSQAFVTAPDCGVCAAGYTLVPGGVVHTVTIDNDGAGTTAANWLTEVQAKYPTAIEATRTHFVYGTSTYTVTFPANFTIPGTIPTETTISEKIGTQDPYCRQTTPTTYAWTAGETFYKIKRTLELTIMEPDCTAEAGGSGNADFAEISATYASNPDYVPGSIELYNSDGCKSVYRLEQYSKECVQDGCDYTAESRFGRMLPYKGISWEPVRCDGWTFDAEGCPVPPAAVTPADCQCGIRFEVAFVDVINKDCCWSMAQHTVHEPISIQVNIRESEFLESGKPLNIPFKVLQRGTFISGIGHQVLRDVIRFRNYRYENFNDPLMPDACLYNRIEGLEYGVEVDEFYYAITLRHQAPTSSNSWQGNNLSPEEEIVWYVKTTDYLTLLALVKDINKMTQSANMGIPPLVV